MKNFIISIVFLMASLTLTAQTMPLDSLAQRLKQYEGLKHRPKIGLVLAGGGAKGSAHIGVIREIEKLGIPIDYIAGTSMGSIIGGLYALGYTADEMDDLISNMDWSIYMSDKVIRSELSSRDKILDNQYLLTIPFATASDLKSQLKDKNEKDTLKRGDNEGEDKEGGAFLKSLPGGFISGNNVLNLLNSLCVGYQDSIDFNSLPIPYACVTTDVLTGKEHVIRSGKLALAIRASMAIPGVFAPVLIGDKMLVDGGMVNNFPVDVCKEMGADIIIGSEVTADKKLKPQDLSSLPSLLGQLMNVVTMGHNKENRKICDIYIRPDITGYGTMSFESESIDSLIVRGEKGALVVEDHLQALRNLLDEYHTEKNINPKRAASINLSKYSKLSIEIDSVICLGVDDRDAKWLMRKARLTDKKTITGGDIDAAIAMFNGTNAYSSVTYTVIEDKDLPGKYNLTFNFKKSEPHTFGFGFRFDSYETAALLLKFAFNERKLKGIKFNVSSRLSYNPWASVKLSYVPRILPSINLAYNFKKVQVTVNDEGKIYSNMRYIKNNVELYFSEYHSRYITTKVGAKLDHFDISQLFGGDSELGLSTNYVGIFGDFSFDNLNKGYFATKGVKFDVGGDFYFSKLYDLSFSQFGDVKLNFTGHIPLFNDKFVIIPQLYSRLLIGHKIPDMYYNVLGGVTAGRYFDQQLPYYGANKPELLYNNVVILRSDFRVNVRGKHYLTGIFNLCREFELFKDIFTHIESESHSWWGYGIQYAYESPVGPLSLDVHWSTFSKKVGLYLNLGFYF